jgi:methionyl aminopeptidase
MICNEQDLADLRTAAKVHKHVRMMAREFAKPGIKMIDLAEFIEANVRSQIKAEGLSRGIAFPTGVSLNECAAHWTPNSGEKRTLSAQDICKIDFGIQVNGMIVDCAFTLHSDPKYDALVSTVKEATNAGIKAAGVDVSLADIGAAVHEVMEAGEVEVNGKPIRIKSIRNLNGHSIDRYRIHGGKSVPIVRGASWAAQDRMQNGELFAIETFGSTGNGHVVEDGEVSHYMRNYQDSPNPAACRLQPKAKLLLKTIEREFGTLAFCRRYLEHAGESKYALALKQLCDVNLVNPYPPLCDSKGSWTAQFEHTIVVKEIGGVEVITRGEDY